MQILKKVIRFLLRSVVGVISLLILYFLFALVLSLIPVNNDFHNAENGITIYVRSNGVHTDFVVPVETKTINWKDKIPYKDFKNVDSTFHFVCFGWGNREFYIKTKEWSDLKFSTACRAMFGLGTSAMHVEYVEHPFYNEHWIELKITEQNYRKLSKYILLSFQTDSTRKFIHITDSGYYSNDTFYEATGNYSMFKTCNEWTGKGLRVCGIKTGAWTPFEKSVMCHLRKI